MREQDNLNCFGQMLSEHLGSQYMGSSTPVQRQMEEKNITSEEEDIGFCCSEDHKEEEKPNIPMNKRTQKLDRRRNNGAKKK